MRGFDQLGGRRGAGGRRLRTRVGGSRRRRRFSRHGDKRDGAVRQIVLNDVRKLVALCLRLDRVPQHSELIVDSRALRLNVGGKGARERTAHAWVPVSSDAAEPRRKADEHAAAPDRAQRRKTARLTAHRAADPRIVAAGVDEYERRLGLADQGADDFVERDPAGPQHTIGIAGDFGGRRHQHADRPDALVDGEAVAREIEKRHFGALRVVGEGGHGGVERIEVRVLRHFDDKADIAEAGCDKVGVEGRILQRRASIIAIRDDQGDALFGQRNRREADREQSRQQTPEPNTHDDYRAGNEPRGGTRRNHNRVGLGARCGLRGPLELLRRIRKLAVCQFPGIHPTSVPEHVPVP